MAAGATLVLLGELKGIQTSLMQAAMNLFHDDKLGELRCGGDLLFQSSELAHNQIEERRFYLLPLTAAQKQKREEEFSGWANLNAILRYDKTMTKKGTGAVSSETRYYVTSLKDVATAAFCTQEHRSVENRLNFSLDTVMMEDAMRVTDRTAAHNMSIINKMCIALLTKLQAVKGVKGKYSKKDLRLMINWDYAERMREVMTLLDPQALRDAVTLTMKT